MKIVKKKKIIEKSRNELGRKMNGLKLKKKKSDNKKYV